MHRQGIADLYPPGIASGNGFATTRSAEQDQTGMVPKDEQRTGVWRFGQEYNPAGWIVRRCGLYGCGWIGWRGLCSIAPSRLWNESDKNPLSLTAEGIFCSSSLCSIYPVRFYSNSWKAGMPVSGTSTLESVSSTIAVLTSKNFSLALKIRYPWPGNKVRCSAT